MTQEIFISIEGSQIEFLGMEDESEAIEIITPATYYFKDGTHYVFYDEMEEGISGVTKNKIELREDSFLKITKKGVTNSTMIFEIGEDHGTLYQTPYGEMQVTVRTRKLETVVEENLIKVMIDYDLDINHEAHASCNIKIQLKPKSAGI